MYGFLDEERADTRKLCIHRRRGSGPGPARRAPNAFSRKVFPYTSVSNHRMCFVGGSQSLEPTKLYLSNLNHGVTNEDIRILFSDIGEMKMYSIHYDQSGSSKGTAEVVYERHSDAIAAIKKYNNCLLDEKPLKIELVGRAIAPTEESVLGKPDAAKKSVYGHGKKPIGQRVFQGNSTRGSGGPGYGYSVGPEQTNDKDVKNLTAEELDADLERYHFEALHI